MAETGDGRGTIAFTTPDGIGGGLTLGRLDDPSAWYVVSVTSDAFAISGSRVENNQLVVDLFPAVGGSYVLSARDAAPPRGGEPVEASPVELAPGAPGALRLDVSDITATGDLLVRVDHLMSAPPTAASFASGGREPAGAPARRLAFAKSRAPG